MTGKLNKQAELSIVSNAIQSKAHRNTKSTLVQHSDVHPLLTRHIKAKSQPAHTELCISFEISNFTQ